MKRSLLLYLTILFALTTLFTYVYLSSELRFEQKRSQKITSKLKDSLQTAKNQLADADYFSLAHNENAQNYFDNEKANPSIYYDELLPIIKESLLDFNENPNGNPYTGQDKIGVNKFIINKIKVLNHRWIIADFSDGEHWGEVLLKYFVNPDKSISFEVNQSILY